MAKKTKSKSSKSKSPAKKAGMKGGVLNIDWGTEESNRTHVEDGGYVLKIKKIKQDTSSKGNPMLVVDSVLVLDENGNKVKAKKRDVRDWVSLTPAALPIARRFFTAVGLKVKKKSVQGIPLAKMVGKEYGAQLEWDDERERMSVEQYLTKEDLLGGDLEDEEEDDDQELDEDELDEDEEDEDEDEDEDDDDEDEDEDDELDDEL